MKNLLGKMFMDLDKIAVPTARRIFLSEQPNLDKLREDEYAFFSSIKLENGTTKTTDRNRMRDVDRWFYEFLPKTEVQKILDVGISSGITTVELCELLDAKNTPYLVSAMDSDLTAYLLILGGDRSVLVDKRGNPIHFEMNGKGFGYVKGTNLKHRIERALLKFKTKMLVNFRLKNNFDRPKNIAEKNGLEVRAINLVCREITENPRIKLLEESVFAENAAEKYGVIRAANILNKGYFSDAQLLEAVRKLANRLERDGFLLVCRTNAEGQNNASLFRLNRENEFEITGRFGEGSEIENIVLGSNQS